MRIVHRKGSRIVVELDDVASAMVRDYMSGEQRCDTLSEGADPRDVVSAAVVFMLDNSDDCTSSQERLVEAEGRRLALEQDT